MIKKKKTQDIFKKTQDIDINELSSIDKIAYVAPTTTNYTTDENTIYNISKRYFKDLVYEDIDYNKKQIKYEGVLYAYTLINNEKLFLNALGKDKTIDNTNLLNKVKQTIQNDELIVSYRCNQIGIIKYDDLPHLNDNCIYELLYNTYNPNISDNVYTYYLDCETSIKKNSYLDGRIKKVENVLYEIIDKIVDILNKIHKDININENIFISTSNGDDENEEGYYKISYHINVPIYVVSLEELYNIHKLLNEYIYNKIRLQYADKNENIIDGKVYVKNKDATRKFRMLYQSKHQNGNDCKYRKLEPVKICNYGKSYGRPEGHNIENINMIDYMVMKKRDDTKYPITTLSQIKKVLIGTIAEVKHHTNEEQKDKYKSKLEYKINKLISINDNFFISSKYNKSKHNVLNYIDYMKLYRSYKIYKNDMVVPLIFSIANNTINTLDFKSWFNVGLCLFNIGISQHNNKDYYLKLYEEWTIQAYKTQHKKHIENLNKIWNDKISSYYDDYDIHIGIPTLNTLARKYDKQIENKQKFIQLYDLFITDATQGLKYNKYEYQNNEPFNIKSSWFDNNKTIIADAYYGEGKTTETIKIYKEKFDFIICISNRRTYGTDLTSKLNQVVDTPILCYLNDNNVIKDDVLIDYIRNNPKGGFVISFESLDKFIDILISVCNNKKVLVFFDESEVLFDNLLKNVNKFDIKEVNLFKNLIKLWKKSYHIVGDGCISLKTISLIKSLNELCMYKKQDGKDNNILYATTNHRNLYKRTFNKRVVLKCEKQVQEMKPLAITDIQMMYKKGHKLIVFCEKDSIVKDIYSSLINYGLPKNKVFAISSSLRNDYDEDDKQLYDRILSNPNDTLIEIDIFIYNSCILNGLSFEKEHFDVGIIISSDFGVQANDAINAIMRSRKTMTFKYYTEVNNNYKDFELFDENVVGELIDNKKRALYNIQRDIMTNDELYEIHTNRSLYKYIINDKQYDTKYLCRRQSYDCNRITGQPIDKYSYIEIATSKLVLEITQYEKQQFDTDEYDVSNNMIIKKMRELKIIYDRFLNFNRAFKTELLEQILIDKNNIIDISTENIVHNDSNDTALKQIKTHIDKTREEYQCVDATNKVKTIEQIRAEGKNETLMIACDKVERHYENTNKIIELLQNTTLYKNIVNKLIAHRKGLKGSYIFDNINYNPNNTNVLMEVLGTDIYNILGFKISNNAIKENNMYDKIQYIVEQYKAEHKLKDNNRNKDRHKDRHKENTRQCVDEFIASANTILDKVNLEIVKDGNEKEIKHNGIRTRYQNYIIVPKPNDENIAFIYSSLKKHNEKITFLDDDDD
jgi:hypothetical protein